MNPSQAAVQGNEHLFVYGSLRRGAAHPMHRVIAEHAEYLGVARFAGRLYDLGRYPGAVVAQGFHPGRAPGVVGELYRIRNPGPLFRLLDRYEGCTDESSGESELQGNFRGEFRRERQPVSLEDGRGVEAWIYLYNGPIPYPALIPGGDYLRR